MAALPFAKYFLDIEVENRHFRPVYCILVVDS